MTDRQKLEKAREWLEDNLLTVPEAVLMTGLSYKKIRNAVDHGVIPTVREKFILKPDLAVYVKRVRGLA